MNIKKSVLMIFITIFLTFLFTFLNDGKISQFGQIFQPFIFALTFSVGIFLPSLRKLFLTIAISLLALMIFIYFFNLLDISNWIGSLGYGMLLMVTFTYLPEFIKKGYIEKF